MSGDGSYYFGGKRYRWDETPSVSWADSSDPGADLQDFAEYVAEQSGYQPTQIFMSQAQKTAFERFDVWFTETKKRLEATTHRHWITRLVLTRQLYGPWHRRSRRLQRLRWKSKNWRRGSDYELLTSSSRGPR